MATLTPRLPKKLTIPEIADRARAIAASLYGYRVKDVTSILDNAKFMTSDESVSLSCKNSPEKIPMRMVS